MGLKEHPIVGRILYRLIRKHIAGTTMSSVIERAKELNGRKLPVSIAFLSDSARDSTKAKYATTTYLELIRRIARMGLKASVQVPLSQIGYGLSEDVASRNSREILRTANNYGVFVWFELNGSGGRLPAFLRNAKGMGYAIGVNELGRYIGGKRPELKSLKVLCTGKAEDKKSGAEKAKGVKLALDSARSVVLQSAPDGLAKSFVNSREYRKLMVFEFQLGCSNKAVSDLVKKGAKASIYVPFGKDWTQYAINNVPENYARFLASSLLKEKDTRNGDDRFRFRARGDR
jgi:proline dehydrogenase